MRLPKTKVLLSTPIVSFHFGYFIICENKVHTHIYTFTIESDSELLIIAFVSIPDSFIQLNIAFSFDKLIATFIDIHTI